jgi:hypothetical protein
LRAGHRRVRRIRMHERRQLRSHLSATPRANKHSPAWQRGFLIGFKKYWSVLTAEAIVVSGGRAGRRESCRDRDVNTSM